jgi:TetR/AcrR family transcriptional repressor of nem operon
MRSPEGHKEAMRARIVEAASHALRKDGLSGVSIPALMKQVGLTHGGFYVHFADRDELVAEAVLAAAAQTGQGVMSEGSADLEAMLRRYVSKGHVDHPEDGCVLAALGTDAFRQKAPVRRAFAQAARGFLQYVEKKLHPNSGGKKEGAKAAPSDEALELATRMIGAVVLARLVADDELAERILATARKV